MFDVGQMSTLDSCVKHFGVGHPSVFHLCSGRWVNISPALHSLAPSTFEHPQNINIQLLYIFMHNVHIHSLIICNSYSTPFSPHLRFGRGKGRRGGIHLNEFQAELKRLDQKDSADHHVLRLQRAKTVKEAHWA